MFDCVIVCRSVTYAQKLAKLLARASFTASIKRLPSGLPGFGCGYGVRVKGDQIADVIAYLNKIEYGQVRVFCEFENGRLEEYR